MMKSFLITLIVIINVTTGSNNIDDNKKVCKVYDESPANMLLYESETGKECSIIEGTTIYSSSFGQNKVVHEVSLVTVDNPFAKYFEIDKANHSLMTGPMKFDRESICYGESSSDAQEMARTDCCKYQTKECLLKFMAKVVVNKRDTEQFTHYYHEFYVKLIDINDNAPTYKESEYRIDLSEGTKVGTKIPIPQPIDQDSREFSIHGYRLISLEQTNQPFILSTFSRDALSTLKNGLTIRKEKNEIVAFMDYSPSSQIYLELVEPLDRETKQNYSLTIQAEDSGIPPLLGSLQIFINIIDENDNHPKFLNRSVELRISENTGISERIYQVKAVDPDLGRNGMVAYQFMEPVTDKRNPFIIDPKTGYIILNQRLDYETRKRYDLRIVARDVLGDSGQDECVVVIHVEDENDEAPTIHLDCNTDNRIRYLDKDSKDQLTFTWSVREYLETETRSPISLALIGVSDRDSGDGGRNECSLDSTTPDSLEQLSGNYPFSLKSLAAGKYELILDWPIDYEIQSILKTKVICHDFGEPRRVSIKAIQILVEDMNDNVPEFEKTNYYFSVKENDTYDGVVGKVLAHDRDSGNNGKIVYTIEESEVGRNTFSIRSSDGLIKVRQVLDREERDFYQFQVYATDQSLEKQHTATATIEVTVLDINDNEPIFIGLDETNVFHFRVSEDEQIGSQIGAIMTNDFDGLGNNRIKYRLITSSVPFIIDEETGAIKTSGELDREKKVSYQFSVIATDNGSPTRSSSAKVSIEIIDVNDNDPVIVFPSQNDTTITISYKEPVNEIIAKIEARDVDENLNGQVHYNYFNNLPKYLFELDEETGELRVANEMVKEDIGKYPVEIHVHDSGMPPRRSTVSLFVKIDDSIPRSTSWTSVKEKLKKNQAFLMNRGRFHGLDDNLMITPGNILIVIVGLVCSVILVLLGLTMYMCKKRGYLNQLASNEPIYKMELYDGEYADHSNPRATTPVLYTSLANDANKTSYSYHISRDKNMRTSYLTCQKTSGHDPISNNNLQTFSCNNISTDQLSDRSDAKKKVYFSLMTNASNVNCQTKMEKKHENPLGNDYTSLNAGIVKECDQIDNSLTKNRYYILYPNEKQSHDGRSTTSINGSTGCPSEKITSPIQSNISNPSTSITTNLSSSTFNPSTEGFV